MGKIQSQGYLIGISRDKYLITHASENFVELAEKSLDKLWHTSIADLLGAAFMMRLVAFIKSHHLNLVDDELVRLNEHEFRVFFSKSGDDYINLELEKVIDGDDDNSIGQKSFSIINRLMEGLNSTESEDVLFSTLVSSLRSYSGFDRAMIYKLEDNGDGIVLAEDKNPGLEPFLGLRYPRTDIPVQARKLYVQNKLRVIYNVADEGTQIISRKASAPKLDLSNAHYRSVSPVHTQYLKNMGVSATLVISIVIEDRIWGMFIFHNYDKPKRTSFHQRQTLQIIAEHLVGRLKALKSNKLYQLNEKVRYLSGQFDVREYKAAEKLKLIYESFAKELDQITIGLCCYNQTWLLNDSISSNQVQQMKAFLKNEFENELFFQTNALRKQHNQDWSTPFQGLIAHKLSEEWNCFFFMLRHPKVRTVSWAGKPDKPINFDPNNPKDLRPRISFQKWVEKVEDEADNWQSEEIHLCEQLGILLEKEYLREITKEDEFQESTPRTDLIKALEEKTRKLEEFKIKYRLESMELEKTNKLLEDYNEAIRLINKERSHSIATLSHELRTPLNGILGISHLLKDELDKHPKFAEYIELQIDSANRMNQTVNTILEFSKSQNQNLQVKLEETFLPPFFRYILSPLKVLAERKGQDFIITDQLIRDKVLIDTHLIEQILVNLVSNAIKFTGENGKIEVGLKVIIDHERKSQLIMSVEDTGRGISKENINRIFDSYFSDEGTTKRPDQSLGFGLFTVKQNLKLLNGEIEVDSEKGKGSFFTTKIPIRTI